eukprot:gene47571-biopygen38994
MVNGQDATNIVTPNIRMSALRNSLSSLQQALLSPPATASELSYGVSLPHIQFADNISACDTGGGYAQMSVMTWGTNPFPGSTDVTTALLRMDVTGESNVMRRLTSQTGT